MIFVQREWNNSDVVSYYGSYHPYRVYGERNPRFDSFSGLILDVKEGMDKGLNYFFSIIDKQISKGVSICIVPSHDPAKTDSGIRKLAQMLARSGRTDATSCLVRHTLIDKLAHGGDRRKEVHLRSISVANRHLVKNREVLLLDDVTTSNNSLWACKELLIQYGGASVVQCLALGQTEGY